MDKKRMRLTVRDGYNVGDYAAAYRNRTTLNPFETLLLNNFLEGLPKKSHVLDVGSGPGIPYDLHLVQRGLQVTGIDIAEKHIAMARQQVPLAEYIRGDFLEHLFSEGTFEGLICLYTLFHIPREWHA